MSPDRNSAPRFGRRQLLLSGGTIVGGAIGVVACAKTHSGGGDGETPSPSANTSTPPSGPLATEAITIPAVRPAQPTSAPELTSATTVSVPETTSTVTPTLAPAITGPATYLNHGPPDANNVALTFHLGGDPTLVGELLDLLQTSGVTSTLFAIGDWLTANPTLGHRVVDDGHELGNHTKSHQSMLKLSRADVRAEIVGGGQALIPFIGSIGKWFRPSGTDVPNDVILEEAGLAGYAFSVGYDIDSRDFTEPGAAAVVARVKKRLHPGAIVSLHFGHRDTIDALPQILELLAVAGLTPVTMTGLLG